MTSANSAYLEDRALLKVSGDDSTAFLERLLSSEMPKEIGDMTPSALLSPQGKVQAAFLLSRIDEGYLIDCAASTLAYLMKRFTMYRLRSAVDLTDLSSDYGVAVALGKDPELPDGTSLLACIHDRRASKEGFDLGHRLYATKSDLNELAATHATAWHHLRRQAGVAEQDHDFGADEVFPTDINLDHLGGVSYQKGCFVGQEVVSRMHHRSSERRRILVAHSTNTGLTAGQDIQADETVIGSVRSTEGSVGLALVRIDRLAAALANQRPLTADGVPLQLDWPSWLEKPAQ